MTANLTLLTEQLKQTSKLTGVRWAAWVVRRGADWEFVSHFGLTRPRQRVMASILRHPEASAWLGGALNSGRTRSRSTGNQAENLGCERIYAFASQGSGGGVLVGADDLGKLEQGFFRILALDVPSGEAAPEKRTAEASLSLSGPPNLIETPTLRRSGAAIPQETRAGELAAGLEKRERLESSSFDQETSLRARHLEMLHQVVQEILGLSEAALIARRAAELLVDIFGYELAMVLVEADGGLALEILGASGKLAHLVQLGQRFPSNEGIKGKVFSSGISFQANDAAHDVAQDPAYIAFPEWHAGSELCVPLKDGAHTFGVVNLERTQKGGFNQAEQESVEVLAGFLASALVSAYRYQELQVKIDQLQAVRETSLDLISEMELQTLFQRVVHRARELAHAKGAVLALVDDEKQALHVAVAEMPGEMDQESITPVHRRVIQRIVESGETVIEEARAEWRDSLPLKESTPFTVIAGVPLKWGDQVVGALLVFDDQPGRVFKDEVITLLDLLAPKVAASVRNARLYSELKQSIESRQLAERKLYHAARLAALGEMAAGIAHELNNPLMTIAGFTELALDELPEGVPQKEALQIVVAEAQRLGSLVRRLLDFSRRGEIVRLPADLNDLVSEALTLVQLQAHRVEVQVKLWNDLPLVQVDPNQIKQVLVNLVQNAFQAMPQGGKITLRTEPREVDGCEWALVSVSDTGEGIPAENLERIYEPFFTTRPTGQGTGLGLPISYGLVVDHGGHIEVESEVGQGSCFTVWLPASVGAVNA